MALAKPTKKAHRDPEADILRDDASAKPSTQKGLKTKDAVYLPMNKIKKNPDNEKIFNMRGIESLAMTIEKENFRGAIEVFGPDDNGNYEISSGHRRYEAMKYLHRDEILCFIYEKPDPITRAERLLSANIYNRTLSPLDVGRAMQYYYEEVIEPKNEGLKQTDPNFIKKIPSIAEFFNVKESNVSKHLALIKMIEPLQKLVENEDFPYTGLRRVNTLTAEQQQTLCEYIKDYNTRYDEQISRDRLEAFIIDIRNGKKPTMLSSDEQPVENINVDTVEAPTNSSSDIMPQPVAESKPSANEPADDMFEKVNDGTSQKNDFYEPKMPKELEADNSEDIVPMSAPDVPKVELSKPLEDMLGRLVRISDQKERFIVSNRESVRDSIKQIDIVLKKIKDNYEL